MKNALLFLVSSSIIADASTETAVFAGGCFWCMEPPFEKINGVIEVVSGYMGGKIKDPTYKEVSRGNSGHREVVRITYDSRIISYDSLLTVFWRNIDPTDNGGQFADRGKQYKTGIFYFNEEQRKTAELSKEALDHSKKFSKPVITEIIPAKTFYPAEDEHQDFYKTNPAYYKRYKMGSGREHFLNITWTKDAKKKIDLKKKLTPLQYRVTQENGTEPPFNNKYYHNKKEGIYVDIVSGEPLFWSGDKFESGTGWPSFTKPLEPKNIIEKVDKTHGMVRTEVRSKNGNSHLGHVFPDGPAPSGLRYCINSASLRFIPKEDLEKEGYSAYKKLF